MSAGALEALRAVAAGLAPRPGLLEELGELASAGLVELDELGGAKPTAEGLAVLRRATAADWCPDLW